MPQQPRREKIVAISTPLSTETRQSMFARAIYTSSTRYLAPTAMFLSNYMDMCSVRHNSLYIQRCGRPLHAESVAMKSKPDPQSK